MDVTYFYTALVIGLFISILVEEFFGISAGGMVIPGYLAMVCDDIPHMLLIFAIAFIVYFIVNYILPKFIILYGKRKFVATLFIGLIIKLILELMFPAILPSTVVLFRGIGVITPSLIASTFSRQGIRYTIPAVLGAAYLTFAILTLLFWIF